GGRPDGARPAAAGVRPGPEVLPRVQPARRAWRDLGHAARRLHRARPQPGPRGGGRLRGIAGARVTDLLIELGCEELPSNACRVADDDAAAILARLLEERRLAAASVEALVSP